MTSPLVLKRLLGDSPLPWAIGWGLIALLVRLPLLLADHHATPGGDSTSYLELASNIGSGEGFGDGYRTPGYPLIILALDAFPGRREDAVVVSQLILGALMVAFVVVVAWRFFGKGAALLAGAVLAVTPATPYAEYAILPGFLFSVLVLALAVLLARALLQPPPTTRMLVALGALCAAAAYVRPTGQILLLAPIVVAAVATRSARETARVGLVVSGVFGVLVAPWVIHNAVENGRFGMSVVTGDTLFSRAFEVDRMPIPMDTPTGAFVADVAASRGKTRLVTAVTLALQDRGVSRADTLAAQEALARRAIAREPWVYAIGTAREMGRLRLDPRSVDFGSDVGPHLPSPPEPTASVWNASSALSAVWWLVSLHAFAGILVLFLPTRRARLLGWSLLATWIAVALGTALGRGALTRYAIELAPITVVLGSAGAAVLFTAIWRTNIRPSTKRRRAPKAHLAPARDAPSVRRVPSHQRDPARRGG